MSIIHETFFKTIIDLISDIKDISGKQEKMLNKNNYKKSFTSLTRNANKLILVFPVLCTKGITIETASMLTKAIEKYCVSLLEVLFASVQIADTTDLEDYISRFHSNISIGDKITVDDFMSFTNLFESAIDNDIIKISDNEGYKKFKEGMKNFDKIAKVTFNENSLSDFACHKTINGYNTILEIKMDNPRLNKHRYPRSENHSRYTLSRDDDEEKFIARGYKDRKDFLNKFSDNDIKKANELMPTRVLVDFYSKDAEVKFQSGVIGVKCKLYAVDSLELIERISVKYADTNWLRELVKASTGEISFWRDFVFALDRAKIDAINSAKRGSTAKMWRVLETRAAKYKMGRWKVNRADASPITTLVVSQDEVEYLKKDYDIDIENRKIALNLMQSYNFMGLFIVDEPAETVSFIWDEGNDANFQNVSFTNLERESNDKNYKKVINLMTKISR